MLRPMAVDVNTKAALPIRDPGRRTRAWPTERIALSGLLAGAALVFGLGIRTALLSDTWSLLRVARVTSLQGTLAEYLPHNAVWYRPTTDLAYWLISHAFGFDPLPGHLLALAAWLLAIVLVHQLALRLTGQPWAAFAGAAAFATSIHAHEALWDVAALHIALLAPVLIGTLLAVAMGRRRLTFLLAVAALTIDEAGLLCLPLALLWELVEKPSAVQPWRERLIRAGRRTLPLVALVAFYVATRIASGGFHAEAIGAGAVAVCNTPTCLAGAAVEYANRLAVRGDPLVAQLWVHRRLIFAVLVAAFAAIALAIQPWRWRPLRPLIFALAWIVLATAFFILPLWPYVADRFVYVPDIGVGLLAAAAVAGVTGAARSWSRSRRSLATMLGVVGAVWLVVGGLTLVDRAGRWVDAGDQSTAILRNLEPYLRTAAPSSLVVVLGVPDESTRPIPPGNTGPYMFHNGFSSACAVAAQRSDLIVTTRLVDVPAGKPVIYLQISGTQVTQLPERPRG